MPVLCLSQAGQDVFARHVVGRKGTFLDLGSFRPTYHNNTRILELEGWSGLSIDYQNFGEEFKQKRNRYFAQPRENNLHRDDGGIYLECISSTAIELIVGGCA
jgi:hypothetical protein